MKREIGDRSRIEGSMHRVCQLAVSVRQVEDGATDDGLLRLRLSASSEYAYTRSSWWDDPWVEVLGHKASEVDLSRLNSGGALLGNHDRYSAIGNTPLASIGAVERAWIENGRVMADVVISRREALADLRQDILDGIVTQVSIGYSINERVLTRAGKDSPDEYRVTSWTPFEISLVDVPADPTIGIGRNAGELSPNDANARPGYRVVELSRSADPAGGQAGNTTQERTMPPVNDVAVENNAANPSQADPLAAERERVRELTALGRQFGCRDDADAAVNAGTSIEAFRTQLLEKIKPAPRVTPSEGDADIGMSGRDLQRFSFARAILYAMDPNNAGLRNAAAFELECSNAARDKRTDETRKEREGGITVPADVLRHAYAIDSASAEAATRMLVARAQQSAAYRDLVVGTATAGGNLVATDLLAGSFIELLRAKSRLI
uniref:hypothetical protein n=1 Tax=Niveibacterium sp. TaxID=2017444 RepID=UPI0035B193BE